MISSENFIEPADKPFKPRRESESEKRIIRTMLAGFAFLGVAVATAQVEPKILEAIPAVQIDDIATGGNLATLSGPELLGGGFYVAGAGLLTYALTQFNALSKTDEEGETTEGEDE